MCPVDLPETVMPSWGDRPRIMGVLNATPDSFSGDGLAGDVDALLARAEAQVAAGAEILDVGGESTRPGATLVPAEEERRRVLPVIERLAAHVAVPVSIDTTKPAIADEALSAGATILNDVSGLRESELVAVAARHDAWLVLTHNGWNTPLSRGAGQRHEAVLEEVVEQLRTLVRRAIGAGVNQRRLIVDPGLGFGKTPWESLELLRRAGEIHERLAPYPLLIGASRKSFIGRALGLPVTERLEGSLACAALAAFAGAEIIRVHDVQPSVRAARMAWAVRQGCGAELVPAEPAEPR
jgi:dihydropteroate synthase